MVSVVVAYGGGGRDVARGGGGGRGGGGRCRFLVSCYCTLCALIQEAVTSEPQFA